MQLTTAQLQILKTWIIANNNSIFDQSAVILLNANASPDFWCWKTNLSTSETGMAIDLSEVGSLTTAKSSRLDVSFNIRPGGFSPAVQSDRALFGDVFSAVGGQITRAELLLRWQRLATVAEKLLATGTGTKATGLNTDGTVTGGSPGSFGVGAEGLVTLQNVVDSASA